MKTLSEFSADRLMSILVMTNLDLLGKIITEFITFIHNLMMWFKLMSLNLDELPCLL